MLVVGDADVDEAHRRWLEGKRSGEYADLIDSLADEDLAIVLWLATSGESSVYTTEARGAMAGFMSTADAPGTPRIQSAIRRLVQAGIVDPVGVKGSYELADQGLQIILGELVGPLVQQRTADKH